jgi:hypothetical protein
MTVRNASGTRMSKTSMKAALTEVPQAKVYTAGVDYFEHYQLDGESAVERGKKLVVKAGGTITEAQVDALFPTARVDSITPAAGGTAGGTVVTIRGSNLEGASGVTFGGVAGTAFSLQKDGSLRVTTPATTAGAKNVVVQDDAGDITVTNGFTYS